MGLEREDEGARIIKEVNGIIISKKKGGTLKDFGTTNKIWSTGFLNYVRILIGFNGITHLLLFNALLAFHA